MSFGLLSCNESKPLPSDDQKSVKSAAPGVESSNKDIPTVAVDEPLAAKPVGCNKGSKVAGGHPDTEPAKSKNEQPKNADNATTIELKRVAVHGEPEEFKLGDEVNFLQWLSTDRLVYAGRSGFVHCYDLPTKAAVWSKKIKAEIKDLAVCGSRVFLLKDPLLKGPGDWEDPNVDVIDADEGTPLTTIHAQAVAKQIGQDFALLDRITWVPRQNWLVISVFDEPKGRYVVVDAQTFKPTVHLLADKLLGRISAPDNGNHLVGLDGGSNIRIWDITSGQEMFRSREYGTGGIDGSHVSNVKFDGNRTLIHSVDHGWSKGSVYVSDVVQKKQLAKFGSHNGHAIMDVDFIHQRIALSGTSQKLTIVDFKGVKLAEASASKNRVYCVAFSPDGKHIAVSGVEGALRVFEIVPTTRGATANKD